MRQEKSKFIAYPDQGVAFDVFLPHGDACSGGGSVLSDKQEAHPRGWLAGSAARFVLIIVCPPLLDMTSKKMTGSGCLSRAPAKLGRAWRQMLASAPAIFYFKNSTEKLKFVHESTPPSGQPKILCHCPPADRRNDW